MQDCVQLTAQLLVGRVRTGCRQLIPQTEEAAYQRSSPGSQKAETFAGLGASDHRLGLVLEDHGLCGDAAHGSPRVNEWVDVPD
jgi:hypothetical protein